MVTVQTSNQYVCVEDNGDYTVEQRFYNDADCTEAEVDDTRTITVATDQEDIDCTSRGCPIYEYRTYIAEAGDDEDTCTKGDSWTEFATLVDVCVLGNRWSCDESGVNHNVYVTLELSNSQLSCTSEIAQTIDLISTGCATNAGVTTYVETVSCSKANQFSVFVLSIFSVVLYMIML